jgi:hypothetical protein
MDSKKFYLSKTFWANIIAAVGVVLADKFGITLSPEQVAMVLGGVNVVLRFITKQPVTW